MNITENETKILNSLNMSCIKHNYPEFVKEFGYKSADERLERLFGQSWLQCRELVWQWYDLEYKGDIHDS